MPLPCRLSRAAPPITHRSRSCAHCREVYPETDLLTDNAPGALRAEAVLQTPALMDQSNVAAPPCAGFALHSRCPIIAIGRCPRPAARDASIRRIVQA